MTTTKKKAPTKADLKRKIVELQAQLAGTLAVASRDVVKAGADHLTASGAMIQIHALGGRVVIAPVVIRDGLSQETIKALQADIARSYELATSSRPVGVALK